MSTLCVLVTSFVVANSLDSDQAGHYVRPHLNSNCLTHMVFLKDVFEIVNSEINQQANKDACEITHHAILLLSFRH